MESEITLLRAELIKIEGELLLSEDKIRNLGQSLEGEGHKDVQNLIKSKLAAVFDSQQELKERKKVFCS